MTKKDYELIAKCLNPLIEGTRLLKIQKTISKFEIEFLTNQVINNFVRKLQAGNYKFNQVKFLEAVNK